MKELKTKKSAEGARVKEKSDALPRAAKRMLRAGLMERQASRQRDTQEKAPERAAEEQVERAALRGGEMAADAGRAVFRQAVPLRAEREKDQWTDAQAVGRYRSASRAAHTDGVGQKTEKISRNREILNRAQEVASRRSDTLRPGAIRQAYCGPGMREGCWHRPGRRRRGWRPPCYPGQAQRLPRRRLFWFWFSLRGWWGRFWLLPSACSFPTKRHRTGCSCGRRRRS